MSPAATRGGTARTGLVHLGLRSDDPPARRLSEALGLRMEHRVEVLARA